MSTNILFLSTGSRMGLLNDALLNAIEREVLHPDVIEIAIRQRRRLSAEWRRLVPTWPWERLIRTCYRQTFGRDWTTGAGT
jgi:hypothetical protein